MAAFAASEGHAHPRVVELPKTDEGLGFNVMGGKEQNSPIYISRIIPQGVADRHGGLKRGDQLISVNGVVSHLPISLNKSNCNALSPIKNLSWLCVWCIWITCLPVPKVTITRIFVAPHKTCEYS